MFVEGGPVLWLPEGSRQLLAHLTVNVPMLAAGRQCAGVPLRGSGLYFLLWGIRAVQDFVR